MILEPVKRAERIRLLIDNLLALPVEKPWVEFKKNHYDEKMIGKLISALSNAARLADEPFAYVLWGVSDDDHAVVGTSFEPSTQQIGKQPLEFWLTQRLKPSIYFRIRICRL